MIIVKIWGGLGNQMFQYASAKALSIEHKKDLLIDTSSYQKLLSDNQTPRNYRLGIFPHIVEKIASTDLTRSVVPEFKSAVLNRVYRKINKSMFHFNRSFIIEKDLSHAEIIINGDRDIYMDGYWQSEKYFKNSEESIKECFNLNYLSTEAELVPAINMIKSTNSVSIHVRRGDYVTNAVTNSYHGVCDLSYYRKAIEIFAEKEPDDLKFFVFSDDVAWCKENLKIPYEHEYISTREDFHDLYLMSLCKHNISANSSFSWWGAWLNTNINKTIISPKKWLSTFQPQDIVPGDWQTI